MPENMRCMFKKGKGSFWHKQEKAIADAPWVQTHLNDRWFVMVDFDGLDEYWWQQLPVKPNIVSFNPKNGNHQCYWLLRDAVHCHKVAKRNKPYKYLRLLEKAIDAKYKGDTHFARAISKNVFHPMWETDWIHDRAHTLAELHKGLELDLRDIKGRSIQPPKRVRRAKKGNGERNSTLFNSVRFRAYKEVSKYKALKGCTLDDFTDLVAQWCHAENVWTDAEPLQRKEIEATATSIANFTWHVFKPAKEKPQMTAEQIKTAQGNAARMTNAKQRGAAEGAIKEAIAQLVAKGKKPSKAKVAEMVGMSRKNVTVLYSHLFD